MRDTGGRMADVVVDVTSYATKAVTDALDLVRRGGTVVLAGTKGLRPIENFLSDKIILKEIRMLGAMGVDFRAYAPAVRLIESGRYPLEKMHTHTVALEQAEHAIKILAAIKP